MAGMGFSTANHMAKSPKRPMGIQFVKSADTVGSPQGNVSSPNVTSGNNDSSTSSKVVPSLMSCQVTPSHQFDTTETKNVSQTDKQSSSNTNLYEKSFVKSGDAYCTVNSAGTGSAYKMPGYNNLNKDLKETSASTAITRPPEAKPMCSKEEYKKAWNDEADPILKKIRRLSYEIVNLKSDRPNAKDKLHSAANRIPLRIEYSTQPIFGAKNTNTFLCFLSIDGLNISDGRAPKIKDAKSIASESCLQKILMPHLRIVPVDPTSKELQASEHPFTSPPRPPSKFPLNRLSTTAANNSDGATTNEVSVSQLKESNLEAAGLKRRFNEFKPLDDFVIVEPLVSIQDCTAAHTLRRSADFNHMLLEYEYFFKGEAARCILRIENVILADVNGMSKNTAKNSASVQALQKLKKFCWVIKTKQAVDSHTKITKDEMLSELNDEPSDEIDQDNIGNKLLRKMGWSGGGVGKDGSGISEPVSLKSVLNREGLGLSSTKGVTPEFCKRVKEVIENFAASDNQEDLVFSYEFRHEERQIIHDECRRLDLRSKSRGKGQQRYLCVRRKRSVNQLINHLMSVGGETVRYLLVRPGEDCGNGTNNNRVGNGTNGLLPSSAMGGSNNRNGSGPRPPLLGNFSSPNASNSNTGPPHNFSHQRPPSTTGNQQQQQMAFGNAFPNFQANSGSMRMTSNFGMNANMNNMQGPGARGNFGVNNTNTQGPCRHGNMGAGMNNAQAHQGNMGTNNNQGPRNLGMSNAQGASRNWSMNNAQEPCGNFGVSNTQGPAGHWNRSNNSNTLGPPVISLGGNMPNFNQFNQNQGTLGDRFGPNQASGGNFSNDRQYYLGGAGANPAASSWPNQGGFGLGSNNPNPNNSNINSSAVSSNQTPTQVNESQQWASASGSFYGSYQSNNSGVGQDHHIQQQQQPQHHQWQQQPNQMCDNFNNSYSNTGGAAFNDR